MVRGVGLDGDGEGEGEEEDGEGGGLELHCRFGVDSGFLVRVCGGLMSFKDRTGSRECV